MAASSLDAHPKYISGRVCYEHLHITFSTAHLNTIPLRAWRAQDNSCAHVSCLDIRSSLTEMIDLEHSKIKKWLLSHLSHSLTLSKLPSLETNLIFVQTAKMNMLSTLVPKCNRIQTLCTFSWRRRTLTSPYTFVCCFCSLTDKKSPRKTNFLEGTSTHYNSSE